MKTILFFCFFMILASISPAKSSTFDVARNDCYEEAFDLMEAFDDLGAPPEVISFWGEWAYCHCAPECDESAFG